MKTSSDVKRKMTLGSTWRCQYLFDMTRAPVVRKVGKVQTNAVAFLQDNGKLSWLYWPKAKEIQINGKNSFTVLTDGRPILKYEFVE